MRLRTKMRLELRFLFLSWVWIVGRALSEEREGSRRLSSSVSEIDSGIEMRGEDEDNDSKVEDIKHQKSAVRATAARREEQGRKEEEVEEKEGEGEKSAIKKKKKSEIAQRIKDLSKLKEFFRETYMEVVKGDLQHFSCFQTTWQLYHMHNVCIKKGNDGIITGIEERPNDWMHLKSENKHIASEEEWNDINMKPTMAIKIPTREISGATFVQGNNILNNCHQQEEEKKNPAHWMMKLGILFEMATCEATGKKYDLSEFKSPQIRLPFDGIFMHQCPQKSQHKWPWGDNVYRIVEEGMQDAGLLDKNYRFHDEFAFEPVSIAEKKNQGY